MEAIPVHMDMYYIQRTRRELNKLKVFVSADTEAEAASSSALNSSPPWSEAPRSGMRISQLLTMPEQVGTEYAVQWRQRWLKT